MIFNEFIAPRTRVLLKYKVRLGTKGFVGDFVLLARRRAPDDIFKFLQ